MKNKEIVMEIIKNNSINNQTEITNKEIIDIAQTKYNKKLYLLWNVNFCAFHKGIECGAAYSKIFCNIGF